MVTEVASRALKACWYQKWFVHRRLRPEAMGGMVHQTRSGMAARPIHSELLNAAVLDHVYAAYGSYLLPIAIPEGCPTHPSYPAGHGCVAGACGKILKAAVAACTLIPRPVLPHAGRN